MFHWEIQPFDCGAVKDVTQETIEMEVKRTGLGFLYTKSGWLRLPVGDKPPIDQIISPVDLYTNEPIERLKRIPGFSLEPRKDSMGQYL